MPLKFVDWRGERLVPDLSPPKPLAEHLVRYDFASKMTPESESALDVACGAGYGTYMVSASKSCPVVGVDIDHGAIDWARAAYASDSPKLNFMTMDATAMNFPDGKFDLITSFETLEHVSDTEKFSAEIFRVLKPGGFLVISVPDRVTNVDSGIVNHYHYSEMDLCEFAAHLDHRYEEATFWVQTLFPAGGKSWASNCIALLSSCFPAQLKAAVKAVLGLFGERSCFDGKKFCDFKARYGGLLEQTAIRRIEHIDDWSRIPGERYAFLAICQKAKTEVTSLNPKA